MKSPAAYLAVILSLGIWLSRSVSIPVLYSLTPGIILAVLAFIFIKNKTFSHLSLYLAIFFAGVSSYSAQAILPPDHISKIVSEDGQKIFLKGAISDDPVTQRTRYGKFSSSFTLEADSVKGAGEWQNAVGPVRVRLYSDKGEEALSFADEVILEGEASRPKGLKNPGLFDYSRYMEIQGIYISLKVKDGASVRKLPPGRRRSIKYHAALARRYVRNAINRYFHSPDNGFLNSILIGDRSDLKKSLNDDFIKTGTVHILSVSGTHVGLIACIFLFVFSLLRLPKKLNISLSVVFLIFYSYVAGLSPPIVRSTIIFSLFAFGYLINRKGGMLNSLSIAAIVMLIVNPRVLFDTGFELSFASIASIVILTPAIDKVLGTNAVNKRRFTGKIRLYLSKSVSVSLAAWIGVAPIVSYYFNITSPSAVIANIVIVPAVFLVMILSAVFLAASLCCSILLSPLSAAIQAVDHAMFFINHHLSALPLAYFRTAAPSAAFMLAYYAALSLFVIPQEVRIGAVRITKRSVFTAALIMMNMVVWQCALDNGKDNLTVTFFDVGQGDSALVEFPGPRYMLIDGGVGGSGDGPDMGVSVVAPSLWNKGIDKIDAVMVTHFHEDHMGGLLYILENFKVGCVMDNGISPEKPGAIFKRYIRILKEKNIRRIAIGEGDEIKGFGQSRVFVLNPDKPDTSSDLNDSSITVKIIFKGSSVLFCGDIMPSSMERLISYGDFLRSDIIKVPHHGGSLKPAAQAERFFALVAAKVSVISVGSSNRFNMPAESTLKMINNAGSMAYETKRSGAVTFALTGKVLEK